MIILQFLSLLCVVAVIMVVSFIVNLFLNIFYIKNKFKKGVRGGFSSQNHSSRRTKSNVSGSQAYGREPRQRKKIIPQDEGEYIDFEEV